MCEVKGNSGKGAAPRWPAVLNAAVQSTIAPRVATALLTAWLVTSVHARQAIASADKDTAPGGDGSSEGVLATGGLAYVLLGPLPANGVVLLLNLLMILAAYVRLAGGGPAFEHADRQYRVRCSDGLLARAVDTVASLLQVSRRVQAAGALFMLALGLYADNNVFIATAVSLHAWGM